jgi:hypothetical protein
MRFLLCIACSFNVATAVAQAPAAAQPPVVAPKPAPVPDKPIAAPAAEPSRPLILRLDEIDGPRPSFGASPGERYQGGQLPALGGDARQVEGGLRGNPYPHSSENLP